VQCYANAVYAVALCPSVYPSVTNQYCAKTAKHRMTQTSPYNSPVTLVSDAKDLRSICEYMIG